jgi:hypothetical protein
MDKEVCDRIVAKYEELEKTGISNDVAIQLGLVLGVLILFSVMIWALNVPAYVKYAGSIGIVIVIIVLAYKVGKFIF